MSSPTQTLLLVTCALAAPAQTPRFDAKHPPRFEDFPVAEKWTPPASRPQLLTDADGYVTMELTAAYKAAPNLAGHFRFAVWPHGHSGRAGAVVDLQTGSVYPPPLAGQWERWSMDLPFFEDSTIETRADSRLVILRTWKNFSYILTANIPDVHYFVWQEDNRFREVLFVSGYQPSSLKRPTVITIIH